MNIHLFFSSRKHTDPTECPGVLTTRTYEKNGVKRKRTEVRCDQVFFGESKKDSGSTPQAAPDPANDDFRPLPDDDDIPF